MIISALSLLSAHHLITESKGPQIFCLFYPTESCLVAAGLHSKLFPSQQLSDVHATLQMGFLETTAIFWGTQQLLKVEQPRVHSSKIIYYSKLLCWLCQESPGQALGQKVFSLVPVCRHSSSQVSLQAILCRTGEESIFLTALGIPGLWTTVYIVWRLQPRDESRKGNFNGRESWKVLGH